MSEAESAQRDEHHLEEKNSPGRKILALVVLFLIGIVGFLGLSGGEKSVQQQSMLGGGQKPIEAQAVSSKKKINSLDEEYRKQIVGKWETERDGKRILTVNEDGTAVMDVRITDLTRLMVGDHLIFNIEWKIEDGNLSFTTTGGKPQDKIDLIVSWYGKEQVKKIKVLDETTMRVPDDDPKSEDHIWTRIE